MQIQGKKIDPSTKLTKRLAKKLNVGYNPNLYNTVGEVNALRKKIADKKFRDKQNVFDVRRESNRTVKSGYGDDEDGKIFDIKSSVGVIKGPDKGTYSAMSAESGGFGENKDNFKKVYARYEPSTLKPLREGYAGPQQGKPEKSYASGTLGSRDEKGEIADLVGGYGNEGLLNRPVGVSSPEIIEAQQMLKNAAEVYGFTPKKSSALNMIFKNKNK